MKKKANRNKKVPKEKLFETSEVWGCNYLKTRCIKNYCECFIRGKNVLLNVIVIIVIMEKMKIYLMKLNVKMKNHKHQKE